MCDNIESYFKKILFLKDMMLRKPQCLYCNMPHYLANTNKKSKTTTRQEPEVKDNITAKRVKFCYINYINITLKAGNKVLTMEQLILFIITVQRTLQILM